MSSFNYFFFLPLTLAEFQAHFPQFSVEHAKELLDYWLLDYNFHSQRFYRAQHAQHLEMLRREFRLHYGRSEFDPFEEEWAEKWESFYDDADMLSFQAMTEKEIEKVESITHNIHERRLDVHDSSTPIGKFARIPLRQMELGGPPDHKVYELWFNALINNAPAVQKQLRLLPYDQYLLSEHWRRVRAAILLSYKAVCQAEPCWYSGESWYGGNWETEIHVHHLSYKNRGNERYEDLTLLCRMHHEQWHAHKKDVRQPPVKIALREM